MKSGKSKKYNENMNQNSIIPKSKRSKKSKRDRQKHKTEPPPPIIPPDSADVPADANCGTAKEVSLLRVYLLANLSNISRDLLNRLQLNNQHLQLLESRIMVPKLEVI